MFCVQGKVIVVTGGSKGIGYALAEALAKGGAKVTIAARDAERGEASAGALRDEGGDVRFVQADVSDVAAVNALFDGVVQRCGRLDVAVNNAAVIKHLPAEEFTENDWQRMADANLKGTFFCCQAARRHMKGTGGKIINLSSPMSIVTSPGRAIYATTKAGINHMTRSLAREWGPDGITVNALAPGLTITELNAKHYQDVPSDLERIEAKIPLGRVAQPADYAGAILFLASRASDYMTGQILYMEGGITL